MPSLSSLSKQYKQHSKFFDNGIAFFMVLKSGPGDSSGRALGYGLVSFPAGREVEIVLHFQVKCHNN